MAKKPVTGREIAEAFRWLDASEKGSFWKAVAAEPTFPQKVRDIAANEVPAAEREAARVRVARAFNTMPFGSVCNFRALSPNSLHGEQAFDEVEVLTRIAMNLESLSETLSAHNEEHRARCDELDRYRSATSGIAFLLGEAAKSIRGA